MVLKLLLCRSLWYFCLGLQCKSSRYDPLEGEDDFHDGDAKEDADGASELGDEAVQLAHQVLLPGFGLSMEMIVIIHLL